jgi:hypothetical protein
MKEISMAAITNQQHNLPLGWAKPKVSLPEQTQDEAIAVLADLILQVWEINRPMDNPSEDNIDE